MVMMMRRYPGASEEGARLLADPACDGVPELVVGAPFSARNGIGGGAISVFSGARVLSDDALSFRTDEADWTLWGEALDDVTSRALADRCDVDGDGRDDLVIGADLQDAGGTDAGAVYVVLGATLSALPSSEMEFSEADFKLVGEAAEDGAGIDVACAGDVDGDGLDEILIGAQYSARGGPLSGAAYLVRGATLSSGGPRVIGLADADLILVGEALSYAGVSVAGAGDVDGDGLADLVVGAHYAEESDATSSSGKAYVVPGATIATSDRVRALIDADVQLLGEAASDLAGEQVGPAGDVDGDGRDDLLVGARGANAADGTEGYGRVYLVLGATLEGRQTLPLADADRILFGRRSGEGVGSSPLSAADIDGDGLSDRLVASSQSRSESNTTGGAYVVLARSLARGTEAAMSLDDADFFLYGESRTGGTGGAFVNAGDIDADGRDDVLVGAWTYATSDPYAALGKVYLLRTAL